MLAVSGSVGSWELKLLGSRQGFEVLPKRGMLFDQLFLRNRKLGSVDKIGKGILMEDANRVQNDPVALEIEPVVSGADSIDRPFASGKRSQRFLGIVQLRFSQFAKRANDFELLERFDHAKLAKALVAESYLEHDNRINGTQALSGFRAGSNNLNSGR